MPLWRLAVLFYYLRREVSAGNSDRCARMDPMCQESRPINFTSNIPEVKSLKMTDGSGDPPQGWMEPVKIGTEGLETVAALEHGNSLHVGTPAIDNPRNFQLSQPQSR